VSVLTFDTFWRRGKSAVNGPESKVRTTERLELGKRSGAKAETLKPEILAEVQPIADKLDELINSLRA